MHGLTEIGPVMITRFRFAAAAVVLLLLMAGRADAQGPGLGASVELVDPKTFRVCADPHNLPFSNEAGEGFENKLAELFARKLGEPVSYTYYPQVLGFVRNTLNALRCDVIIGVAVGDNLVQTTNSYYHTTYALAFRPGSGIDGVDSLGDPRLKGKHIGIVAGTPPATVLVQQGLMALARPYALTVDTRIEAPARTMAEDIAAGQIDAGVLWGPIAGYYSQRVTPHLVVVPLLKEHEPMEFRIAMGVRRSDQDWKRRLNRLIGQSQPEIDKILAEYGVPLLDEQGKLTSP
jgi:quinoprotein dehydrogenase-associated probable ABC transporter substrate-binding protein